MALLDEKRDVFVVRIVYDGPPFSGKTTSLRALSAGVHQQLDSPEEREGRTLYFDWVDYTAGRFEGRSIRCQVVSVPGQRSLAKRRRLLLSEADAVVFVADTGRMGMELSTKYAGELAEFVAHAESPPPGVVIQANKRDVDDSLELPLVVQAFRQAGLEAAVMETTASDGKGIREAFLFSVRLALDRVRELSRRGLLGSGRPPVDSARDLLAKLSQAENEDRQCLERSPIPKTASDAIDGGRAGQSGLAAAPIAQALQNAIASENDGNAERAEAVGTDDEIFPDLPDPNIPSGYIWPPVRGRIIMQQALVGQSVARNVTSAGDIVAYSANGWRLKSYARDRFADQEAGRSALINWARLHVRHGDLLSDRRCVALCRWGHEWRLWQFVGREHSLKEMLEADRRNASAAELAEALLVCARRLVAAGAAFRKGSEALSARLSNVAADRKTPTYIGFMPGNDSEREPRDDDGSAWIERLLRSMSDTSAVRRLVSDVGAEELAKQLRSVGLRESERDGVATALANHLLSVVAK